jgi:hypothetical protein
MNIGDVVYFFENTERPILTVRVLKNTKNIPEGWQRVYWWGGDAICHIPVDRIFKNYDDALKYSEEQFEKEKKQQENKL